MSITLFDKKFSNTLSSLHYCLKFVWVPLFYVNQSIYMMGLIFTIEVPTQILTNNK